MIMYNYDRKEAFINSQTGDPKTAREYELLFEAAGEFERKWCADLCTRTQKELQVMVDGVLGLRTNSKWKRLAILKDYVKWCINNKVPGARDDMLRITSQSAGKMKTETVVNPAHLQMCLDEICEPQEYQSSDIRFRCFYWLAYAGMRDADIFCVTSENVDLYNMVIRLGEREYPIYREAVPAIRCCAEAAQFSYVNPRYKDKERLLRNRIPGESILRGVSGTDREDIPMKSFRVQLSRRTAQKIAEGKTTMRLSYNHVWLSGLFYRLYEDEKQMAVVDQTYEIDLSSIPEIAKDRRLVRCCTEDYIRWKLAYNL